MGCALLDAFGEVGDPGCVDPEMCGDGEPSMSPTAVAGNDRTISKGLDVTLDGSRSRPSASLTYTWTLAAPFGSVAALDDINASAPTFHADLEGIYVASLVVSSGAVTSEPDDVTITARNDRPTGAAGPDQLTYTGMPVMLGGEANDPNGDPIFYRWTIRSAPPGSIALLDDASLARPTFVPDRDGDYEFRLVASDGSLDAHPDDANVESAQPPALLQYRVVDAEYSRVLDRIVMVSETPDQLHIYDAATGADKVVELPGRPTSVSVSPDGMYAAVGHNGAVSHVHLRDGTLLSSHPVSTDVLDVVMAANMYAYALPRAGGWAEIRCLDLADGTETLHTGAKIYAGTVAKAHPLLPVMYAADNGVAPDDIEKLDISHGTANLLYDSPYSGHHPVCGNLWMSDDGLRIFTRCGRVFRSSGDRSTDMMFNGALDGVAVIRHLDHASKLGKIVVVPEVETFEEPAVDTGVRIYNYANLEFERTVELTKFLVRDTFYPAHGRFVFVSGEGMKFYVVVQADKASGLLNDYAVVAYEL